MKRLDALQAGILSVKLRHMPDWTQTRRDAAKNYDDLLQTKAGPNASPYVPEWSRPVYHLYVIRVTNREAAQRQLADAGIGSGINLAAGSTALRVRDVFRTARAAGITISAIDVSGLTVARRPGW